MQVKIGADAAMMARRRERHSFAPGWKAFLRTQGAGSAKSHSAIQ